MEIKLCKVQKSSAQDLRALLLNVQQPVQRVGGVVEAIFKTVESKSCPMMLSFTLLT